MIQNIFDTHFHLSEEDKMSDFINDAKELGVNWFMEAGAKPGQMEDMLKRLEPYSNVFAAVGVHPLNVNDFNDDYDLYRSLTKQDQVKAIGEIGLDYYYERDSRDKQLTVFQTFLNMGKEEGLPSIVHCRNAFEDLFKIIPNQLSREDSFVVHCFSEDATIAKKVIDLGGMLSFTGLITFKNAETIRQAMASVPIEKIMFETDTPYLTPVPYRGKRNKPAYTRYIAEYAANYLNMDLQELINITTQNAFRFFKLEK